MKLLKKRTARPSPPKDARNDDLSSRTVRLIDGKLVSVQLHPDIIPEPKQWRNRQQQDPYSLSHETPRFQELVPRGRTGFDERLVRPEDIPTPPESENDASVYHDSYRFSQEIEREHGYMMPNPHIQPHRVLTVPYSDSGYHSMSTRPKSSQAYTDREVEEVLEEDTSIQANGEVANEEVWFHSTHDTANALANEEGRNFTSHMRRYSSYENLRSPPTRPDPTFALSNEASYGENPQEMDRDDIFEPEEKRQQQLLHPRKSRLVPFGQRVPPPQKADHVPRPIRTSFPPAFLPNTQLPSKNYPENENLENRVPLIHMINQTLRREDSEENLTYSDARNYPSVVSQHEGHYARPPSRASVAASSVRSRKGRISISPDQKLRSDEDGGQRRSILRPLMLATKAEKSEAMDFPHDHELLKHQYLKAKDELSKSNSKAESLQTHLQKITARYMEQENSNTRLQEQLNESNERHKETLAEGESKDLEIARLMGENQELTDEVSKLNKDLKTAVELLEFRKKKEERWKNNGLNIFGEKVKKSLDSKFSTVTTNLQIATYKAQARIRRRLENARRYYSSTKFRGFPPPRR